MAKPTTIKIRLNSTADTGHFYVTKKNARTMTEKMVVKKYDPVARKHVEYKEGKIKESSPQTEFQGRALRGPFRWGQRSSQASSRGRASIAA